YDLYDVFNAILYSLTTGCQWRELPHDRSLNVHGVG
ncbi:transposase, partial [Lacticaseibacillus paracasei]